MTGRIANAASFVTVTLPLFIQPSAADMRVAGCVARDWSVRSWKGSRDWDDMDDNSRIWIAAIVREACRSQMIPGEMIAEINAFIILMAKRFRRRTARRFLGIRINTMSRTQAMGCALATYDATLDLMGVPFGHPDYTWDRAAAHEFVDTELQHWEP